LFLKFGHDKYRSNPNLKTGIKGLRLWSENWRYCSPDCERYSGPTKGAKD
jgi:hypothetical protein